MSNTTQTKSSFDRECLLVPRANRSGEDEKKGGFWNKEEPGLNTQGRLVRGGMWAHQVRWWEAPNFVKVLVGGYGSGKTITACKRGIASSIENSPAPIAIVSPSYNLARQTTVATIQELLAGKQTLVGRKALPWRYNKNEHVFRFRYRGRNCTIQILSGDKPDSLRGPNLASAYIDEPFIQSKEVYDQMLARVRHPDARKLEIGLTGTPEQLNWGYDLCVGDDEQVQDVAVITASTRANLVLPPDYVKRLEAAYDEKTAQAYIEGRFVNMAQGRIYYGFDHTANVVSLEMPPGAELGFGVDFNVDPLCVAVFWRYMNHVHFIAEYEFPDADTEYICAELKEEWWDRGLRDAYPDATGSARKTSAPGGKSDFSYIRAAGFVINANNTNPKRRDRFAAWNGKAKGGVHQRRPTLTFDPSCRKLIKYQQLLTHANENKNDGKRMGHLMDAASYPVAHLFPADKASVVGELKYEGM